ncbi:UNVERIFIED_CONTAM: hypothetical protein FKN15_011258 [Acipenser sinensis]
MAEQHSVTESKHKASTNAGDSMLSNSRSNSAATGGLSGGLTQPAGWQSLLSFTILFLAWLAGFSSRLFAVIRFESIIHEFDPCCVYFSDNKLKLGAADSNPAVFWDTGEGRSPQHKQTKPASIHSDGVWKRRVGEVRVEKILAKIGSVLSTNLHNSLEDTSLEEVVIDFQPDMQMIPTSPSGTTEK